MFSRRNVGSLFGRVWLQNIPLRPTGGEEESRSREGAGYTSAAPRPQRRRRHGGTHEQTREQRDGFSSSLRQRAYIITEYCAKLGGSDAAPGTRRFGQQSIEFMHQAPLRELSGFQGKASGPRLWWTRLRLNRITCEEQRDSVSRGFPFP